jgi:carboxylesterase type B
MSLNPEQVLKMLQSNLSDSLLGNYGLSKSQLTNVSSIEEILQSLLHLESDALFAASIARFTREFSRTGAKVYSYHFDRGNPFSGPLKGIANHGLDLNYVFGNYLKAFPEKKDADLSLALMRYWVKFAHGKEPWVDYSFGKALHITADAETFVVPRQQVTSRRWPAYTEMEKNWEEVANVGNMLMNPNLDMKST